MYKNILVALDGKPESDQALKQAISLAKLCGASLTGISVIEKLPAYAATVGEVEEVKVEMEKYFARIQANAMNIAAAAGINLKTATRAGKAAHIITNYAESNGVDLIILGAGSQQSLGGTADKVVESASCSVLIARVSLPSIRVREIMTENVLAIEPSTPLTKVVELLIEKQVKAVPVVERNKVVGIITGGDLLARAGMGLRLSVQRILPDHALLEQVRQLGEQGKTAKDIMTQPVITVRKDENVQKAANLMVEKHVKRLPVIDEQGNLVGIISRTDILSLVACNPVSTELFPAIGGKSPRTVGDIMFRDVPTVDPDTPMSEVLNKILATPLRRVVVIDESKRILGIIVDTDLIKTVHQQKGSTLKKLLSRLSYSSSSSFQLSGKASEVMSQKVYQVKQDTPLYDAVQLMIEKHIKRLVVTDENNRLLGMVSRDSILKILTS